MTPGLERLLDALEATWPPIETACIGGWRVRRGQGGGSRVSSVRPEGDPGCALSDAIDRAEAIQRAWGQTPLFQLTERDAALEMALAGRGYRAKDPTVLMAVAAAELAERDLSPVVPVEVDDPLAAMEAIWATDGVGPARLAVMARAPAPKMRFALRMGDRICGVAFVSSDREIAMLHALATDPRDLRRGVGRAGVIAAARFARACGAESLAVAVTAENAPARALYTSLGFTEFGRYLYRIAHE